MITAYDNTITIAANLLECSEMDIEKLEDLRDDMEEVIQELKEQGIKITYQTIMEMVIFRAIRQLTEDVEDLVSYFEESDNLTDEDLEELEDLQDLNPETDIEIFWNGKRYEVWMTSADISEKYNLYLKDDIEDFEYRTGYNPSYY